jgi:hypothetical protein
MALEEGAIYENEWSRQFAYTLLQSVLLIALSIDDFDLPTLVRIYSASILFPWVLSISAALYALRGESKAVLVWMLIGLASVNLLSGHILGCEHQTLALLSWPIICFLLRNSSLNWSDSALLLGLLLLYTRLYPSAVITSLLFAGLAVIQIRRQDDRRRLIYIAALILSVVAICIAAESILFPESERNRGTFSRAIFRTLQQPAVIVTVVFEVLLFVGWCFGRRWPMVLAGLLPVILAIYTLITRDWLSAQESFNARTLTLTLLPLTLIFSILTHWQRMKLDLAVAGTMLTLVSVLVGLNLADTRNWYQFKSRYQELLSSITESIALADTDLPKFRQHWSWNNTLLSIVWSEGCVGPLINNSLSPGHWEPSAPPMRFRLVGYTCYSSEWELSDSAICSCSR